MDIEDILLKAVRNRTTVKLRYRSSSGSINDLGWRLAQPHVLYRSTHGTYVDVYQISGATSSKSLPGWRPLIVDNILELEELEVTFTPAPGLNLSSNRYTHLVAHCMEDAR